MIGTSHTHYRPDTARRKPARLRVIDAGAYGCAIGRVTDQKFRKPRNIPLHRSQQFPERPVCEMQSGRDLMLVDDFQLNKEFGILVSRHEIRVSISASRNILQSFSGDTFLLRYRKQRGYWFLCSLIDLRYIVSGYNQELGSEEQR